MSIHGGGGWFYTFVPSIIEKEKNSNVPEKGDVEDLDKTREREVWSQETKPYIHPVCTEGQNTVKGSVRGSQKSGVKV